MCGSLREGPPGTAALPCPPCKLSLSSLAPPPNPLPSAPALLPCVRRKVHNPRILLLNCPLKYKKGENQTNVELMREEDW